jgi:sugar transferase (PEP-CTERM/EpsH1 system associated)
MKILFLTAEPPWPLDQGDKLRNHHLLKALAAEHEVTLATFCLPGEENGPWREALAPLCHAVHTVSLSRRQMVLNVLRLPHLPVTMAARASARMVRLLRQLTREQKFDVAYACQLKTAGYLKHCRATRRVADLTDAVSLYRRRMLCFARSWPAKAFGAIEAQRLAFWEKQVAQLADLTLVVSPVDAAVLKEAAPGACVAVLPNGVDLDHFRPLPDPQTPVLLFYGHLRYPPNADGIVWFCHEIFPLVREAVPEAELWIAGKEPPPEVAALAALPGVTLTGYVPDLRPYLAQAAVVVVPLRFGAGTRLKILEAFAAGRPVVSTPLGCEGLEVQPGVHLEVAKDAEALAKATVDLLLDAPRRVHIAANARALVEKKYSWEAIGHELRAILVKTFSYQSVGSP